MFGIFRTAPGKHLLVLSVIAFLGAGLLNLMVWYFGWEPGQCFSFCGACSCHQPSSEKPPAITFVHTHLWLTIGSLFASFAVTLVAVFRARQSHQQPAPLLMLLPLLVATAIGLLPIIPILLGTF